MAFVAEEGLRGSTASRGAAAQRGVVVHRPEGSSVGVDELLVGLV